VLFGAKFIGAADDGETPGLIPFLHNGPVGVIAGAIAFTALAVILTRVGRRQLA